MSDTSDDRILASAAQFLIEGGEEDSANVLLACDLKCEASGDTWCVGDEVHDALHISITAPRSAYEILTNEQNPITQSIRRAIEAVLSEKTYIKHFTVKAQLVEIDPNWRTELLEIARGRGVHNQAVTAKSAAIWKNLRFRSKSEMRIAQAFDRFGVLYLPNCKARLGKGTERENREPDFLVCHEGKWGILEVDGEPFHPPTRTVHDHERDRLFRAHGIRLVEHFDAPRCFNEPDAVVERFLDLLSKP